MKGEAGEAVFVVPSQNASDQYAAVFFWLPVRERMDPFALVHSSSAGANDIAVTVIIDQCSPPNGSEPKLKGA